MNKTIAKETAVYPVPRKSKGTTCTCPRCGSNVISFYNYCPTCGQHLKWGERDE